MICSYRFLLVATFGYESWSNFNQSLFECLYETTANENENDTIAAAYSLYSLKERLIGRLFRFAFINR